MAGTILVLVLAICGRHAGAQTPTSLAGTWIAIDDGFPRLVANGLILPTEELLVVDGAGKAESVLMNITGGETHYNCQTGWGCSDMAAVRRATAGLIGGELVFSERLNTEESAKITREAQKRAAGLTLIAASPRWNASFEASGRRVRFQSGGITRVFARIEPNRLNILRSALLPVQVSYARHWRCFLSNATASDAAFDFVGGPRAAPPAWFEDYLVASSLYVRLDILAQKPTADDPHPMPDPDWQKSAAREVSNSMLGSGVAWPRGHAEKLRRRAQLLAIHATAATGDETLALQGARQIDPSFSGSLGMSAPAMAALRTVMRAGRDTDPEVRSLFCLDLKAAPLPRPDYDPFAKAKLD